MEKEEGEIIFKYKANPTNLVHVSQPDEDVNIEEAIDTDKERCDIQHCTVEQAVVTRSIQSCTLW